MERTGDAGFRLPEDPSYSIADSMRDSVRFAVDRTLETVASGRLASKSSFVNFLGEPMKWHAFGTLEGPGWAANAVGGAHEIWRFGAHAGDPRLCETALSVADHVLEDGFVDASTGFITGYRDTVKDVLHLNYVKSADWFCAGSMARVGWQFLEFGSRLGDARGRRMKDVAIRCAEWIAANVGEAPNGWWPRRSAPSGEPYPLRAEGGEPDPIFATSGDGTQILLLMASLTEAGLADWSARLRRSADVFAGAGGFFGSINHDTYDPDECVARAIGFRTLLRAARVLGDPGLRDQAYRVCLAGIDRFKIREDRNGCATKGLVYMEDSWDTCYLWEAAECASAYVEAFADTGDPAFRDDALTLLRAIAKHHHGPHGFLTEGCDWNNHVGDVHHFGRARHGDIQYTEPFLNGLHIVEPTLMLLELGVSR